MDHAVPTQSVTHRIMKGAGLVMASRLVVNGIAFASSIVLARLLMPEDFGLVALAISIGTVVTALTALPIAEALIRIDHIEDDHLASAFTLGLMRSVALTLILAGAAWPAAHLYQDDRIAPIMLVMAANALISGFYSPRWPLIQKRLSFGPDVVVGVSVRFVAAVASVLIAYYYRSHWAIVIPILLMQLMGVLFSHLYAPYRFRFSIKRIREIWSFSIWMTFSAILNALNARFDSLLIGAVLGARAVGFYSYGDEKASLPTRELSGPLVRVLFPGLAAVKSDPDRLASAYKRTQAMIFALCVPFGVGFALVSDMFVHSLLGGKWEPIIPVMQVLGFALAFENLIIAAGPLAMAMGFTRALFTRDVIAFACRLPLVVAGLLAFGIPGILAARVLAMLCLLGLYLSLAKQIAHVPVRDQLRGCSRSIAALTAMIIAVLLFKMALPPHAANQIAALFVTTAVGGLTYVISHALFWQIAGRPDGPEAEIVAVLQKLIRKRAQQ